HVPIDRRLHVRYSCRCAVRNVKLSGRQQVSCYGLSTYRPRTPPLATARCASATWSSGRTVCTRAGSSPAAVRASRSASRVPSERAITTAPATPRSATGSAFGLTPTNAPPSRTRARLRSCNPAASATASQPGSACTVKSAPRPRTNRSSSARARPVTCQPRSCARETTYPPTAPAAPVTSRLLDRSSDEWVALILAALGSGGPHPGGSGGGGAPRSMRYSELSRRLAGVSQKMLTQTLRSLERDGLVARTVTPTVPVTVSYELTDLGLSLQHVMGGIKAWAETHMNEVLANRDEYDTRIA